MTHRRSNDPENRQELNPNQPRVKELHRGALWRSMLLDGLEFYAFDYFSNMMRIPEYWLFLRLPKRYQLTKKPIGMEGRWLKRVPPKTAPNVEVIGASNGLLPEG